MDGNKSLRLNAAEHPLASQGEFESLDQYFNYLLHLRAYEELLPLVRGQHVLDLGCNNGYGTNHIREACREIVGVDVSADAVADGLARFGKQGLRLEVFDGRTLPFAGSTFDVVISLQVIEHIDLDRMAAYLGEAVRVLKPGGTAVFTTPNGTVRVAPGARPWNEFHVREFSAELLRAELTAFFDDVEIRGLFGSPAVYDRVLASYLAAQRANRPGSWRNLLRETCPPAVRLIRRLQRLRGRRLSSEEVARYSTSDLHYRTDSLEGALDFMAVCRKT